MSKLEKILKSLNPVNIAKSAVSTKAGRYITTAFLIGALYLGSAKTANAEDLTSFDNELATTQIEDGPKFREGKIENRVLGIANLNGPEELYDKLRILYKLDKDQNLAFDFSGGVVSDKDLDAFLIGIKGSYGQYFELKNKELYAELNANLGADTFKNNDYELNRRLTGVGFRVGLADKNLITDFSFNYSLGKGRMTMNDDTFSNNLNRTELKGQARFGRTNEFPFEIGFNYVKEDLDNICDQLAFTFGAGVLYRHEILNGKDALAKIQSHVKYEEATSGNHFTNNTTLALQAEYHLRVYDNMEFMLAVVGTDNGNYQVAFSIMNKGKVDSKR